MRNPFQPFTMGDLRRGFGSPEATESRSRLSGWTFEPLGDYGYEPPEPIDPGPDLADFNSMSYEAPQFAMPQVRSTTPGLDALSATPTPSKRPATSAKVEQDKWIGDWTFEPISTKAMGQDAPVDKRWAGDWEFLPMPESAKTAPVTGQDFIKGKFGAPVVPARPQINSPFDQAPLEPKATLTLTQDDLKRWAPPSPTKITLDPKTLASFEGVPEPTPLAQKPKPLATSPWVGADAGPSVLKFEAPDDSKQIIQKTAQAVASGTGYTAGVLRDHAREFVKAIVVDTPMAIIGLQDMITGGSTGKGLESLGIDLKKYQNWFDEMLPKSERQMRAAESMASAETVFEKIKAVAQNPSIVSEAVMQAIPLMFGGARLGLALTEKARPIVSKIPGLKKYTELLTSRAAAAGIGEGAISAGSQAEQIRLESPDRLLSPMQTGVAALTGAAVTGLGLIGQKTAKRFGFDDPDALMVGIKGNPALRRPVAEAMLLSAFNEGVLEEFGQSVAEQVLQNFALGRPLGQGVADAAILGTAAGGFMGAGMTLLSRAGGGGQAETPGALPPPGPAVRPQGPTTMPFTPPGAAAAPPASAAGPTASPRAGTTTPAPAWVGEQEDRFATLRVLEQQLADTKSPKRKSGLEQEITTLRRTYEDAYQLAEQAGVDVLGTRKQVEAIVPEAPAKAREYSSTQVDLPEPLAERVLSIGRAIPDVDLAEDGRETKPHVTVKWGLHTNDADEVRAILAKEAPFTVTLGKTSFFPNGESGSGDVLKVDVTSARLRRLNKQIGQALEHTSTHPGYQPHVTVAYLKPGRGKAYEGDDALAGTEMTVDRLVFSDQNGQRVEIPLGAATNQKPKGIVQQLVDQEAAMPPQSPSTVADEAKPGSVATNRRLGIRFGGANNKLYGGIKEVASFEEAGEAIDAMRAVVDREGMDFPDPEVIDLDTGQVVAVGTHSGRLFERRPGGQEIERHDGRSATGWRPRKTIDAQQEAAIPPQTDAPVVTGPLAALQHHVSGAIARGEADPITERPVRTETKPLSEMTKEEKVAALAERVRAKREGKAPTEALAPTKLAVTVGTMSRPVDSFEEAARLQEQMRDKYENETGLGSSSFPNVLIQDTTTGETIAYVSWNGRIWEGTPQAWTDKTKEIERVDGRGYGKPKPIDVEPVAPQSTRSKATKTKGERFAVQAGDRVEMVATLEEAGELLASWGAVSGGGAQSYTIPSIIDVTTGKMVAHKGYQGRIWEGPSGKWNKDTKEFTRADGSSYEKTPAADAAPKAETAPATTAALPFNAEVRHNAAQKSVEVKFPKKPDVETLSKLKAQGYRWAKTTKVWYKRMPNQTADQAVAAARGVLGATPTAAPQSAPRSDEPVEMVIQPIYSDKPATTVTLPPSTGPNAAEPGQTILGPKPTTKAKRFTEIGKNAAGETLYQDEFGVRSIVEDGIRRHEPVSLVPTSQGVQYAVNRSREDRKKQWEPVAAMSDEDATIAAVEQLPTNLPGDKINPKVRTLVALLAQAGVPTTMSGDLYGDELVYVDLSAKDVEAAVAAGLPDGWVATWQHTALTHRDVLGKKVRSAQAGITKNYQKAYKKQRLARAGSEAVSKEEAQAVVNAVLQGRQAGNEVPVKAKASSAWGYPGVFSPGAQIDWIQAATEDGPIRVRHAIMGEGWASGITKPDRLRNRFVEVEFDDARYANIHAVASGKIEPAWENGQLVKQAPQPKAEKAPRKAKAAPSTDERAIKKESTPAPAQTFQENARREKVEELLAIQKVRANKPEYRSGLDSEELVDIAEQFTALAKYLDRGSVMRTVRRGYLDAQTPASLKTDLDLIEELHTAVEAARRDGDLDGLLGMLADPKNKTDIESREFARMEETLARAYAEANGQTKMPLEGPVAAFNAKELARAFELTEAEAEAAVAIAEAMDLDTSKIQVTSGGVPGEGALEQAVRSDDLVLLRAAIDNMYESGAPQDEIEAAEVRLLDREEELEARGDALREGDPNNEDEAGLMSVEENLAYAYYQHFVRTQHRGMATFGSDADAINNMRYSLGLDWRPDGSRMTDAEVLAAAKDAYETYASRVARIRSSRYNSPSMRAALQAAGASSDLLFQEGPRPKTVVHHTGEAVQFPGRYDKITIKKDTIAVTSEHGYILVVKNPSTPTYMWVNHIRVQDTAQRQGEGTALYAAALKAAQEAGYDGLLRGDVADRLVSTKAQGMWARFEAAGLTKRIIEPDGRESMVLVKSPYQPSEVRNPRTGADFHDVAVEANEKAAALYDRAAQGDTGAKVDAIAASQTAQTKSGDAGGPRKDVFKAEELGEKGAFDKAAALHRRQAEFHRGRAANWRKQVTPNVLFQAAPVNAKQLGRWYYSNISKALQTWQPKGSGAQLLAHLKKFKGAQEEADETGFTAWLEGQDRLTREDAQRFLDQNQIVVTEVTKRDEREDRGFNDALNTLDDFNFDVYGADADPEVPEGTLYILNRDGGKLYYPDDSARDELPPEVDAAFSVLVNHVETTPSTTSKYASYQVPGGTNYREVLLTLPAREAARTELPSDARPIQLQDGEWWVSNGDGTDLSKGQFPTKEDAIAEAIKHINAGRFRAYGNESNYSTPHWDEPNVLAHVRLNDRVINGQRVLFVEEIQSDWHQKGRREGYAQSTTGWVAHRLNEPDAGFGHWRVDDADGNYVTTIVGPTAEGAIRKAAERGVPDAPFKGAGWKKLALKRVLALAAEGGYDGVAWTTGAQQNDRYSLEKQVNKIMAFHRQDGLFDLMVFPIGRTGQEDISGLTANKLSDTIGKELAEKIQAQPQEGTKGGAWTTYDGLDLKIQGSGMVGFYDRELPNLANEIVRKYGVKASDVRMTTVKDATMSVAEFRRLADEVGVDPGDIDAVALEAEGSGKTPRQAFRDLKTDGALANQSLIDDLFEGTDVTAESESVHFLPLTQQMREDIRDNGLPLFQGAKAAVEFAEGGEAIIRALDRPDVSSAVHELAHVARRFLLDRNLAPSDRMGITDAHIETAEEWAGAENGVWSVKAEEKFARGFEQYLRTGKAPTSLLQDLFAAFRQWLGNIYDILAGSDIDVEITPAMQAVYDALVTRRGRRLALMSTLESGETMTPWQVREESIKKDVQDSKKSGARHLDGMSLDVETLRGQRFRSLRDGKDWIATTVDNRGTVYFVSAAGEMVSEEIGGKELSEFVLQPQQETDAKRAAAANKAVRDEMEGKKPTATKAKPAAPKATEPPLKVGDLVRGYQGVGTIAYIRGEDAKLNLSDGQGNWTHLTDLVRVDAETPEVNRLAQAFEDYDGEGTIEATELADIVENLIAEGEAPAELAEALDNLRSEQADNRDTYGDRGGDDAEVAFVEAVRRAVAASDAGSQFAVGDRVMHNGQPHEVRERRGQDPRGMVRVQADGDVSSRLVRADQLTPAAAAPATGEKARKQAQIDKERAENKTVRAAKIKELKAKLHNQTNVGVDPEILGIVIDILETYIKDGILNFRQAALAFQRDFGDGARDLDDVFEAAWEMYRDEERSVAEALDTTESDGRKMEEDSPNGRDDAGNPEELAEPESGARDGVASGRDTGRPATGSAEDGRPGRGALGAAGSKRKPGVRTGAGRRGASVADETTDRPAGGEPGPVSTDSPNAPSNYRITDADQIGVGGAATKFKQNIAAIKLAKAITAANRPATVEEQRILVKFVGWGGLKRELSEARQDLIDDGVMSADEYLRAFQSVLNAHYTSPGMIRAIWDGVKAFGFQRGRVLEPSMGIGHFIGMAPADITATQIAGIELDSLTGMIGQLLYPKSKIQVTGFQDATLPADYFDLVISNVPFGKIPIADPASKIPGYIRARIHNYFFAKALQKVRPGGMIAFVTTHGTMDAADSTPTRKYLDERADFLGAVRLPDTTFKANAGTEVVTDVIFLRRRAPGEPNRSVFKGWVEAERKFATRENPQGVSVSSYFVANPYQVIGKMGAEGTMYGGGGQELSVKYKGDDVPAQATERFKALAAAAPIGYVPQTHKATTEPPELAPDAITEQMFYLDAAGKVRQRVNGQGEAADMSAGNQAIMKNYIGLRDAYRNLIATMRDATSDDAAVAASRKPFEKAYNKFVKDHGFLHKSANARLLLKDPFGPSVMAIEDWDADAQEGSKAAIFTQRTAYGEVEVTAAESPAHALSVSLAETGGISWPRIASLLSMSQDEAKKALHAAGRVFEQPNGVYEITERYLSGRVRDKLAEARAAAELDSRFQENVEALEKVQPVDLGEDRISVHLGAPWVPLEVVNDFIRHLGGNMTAYYRAVTSEWSVQPASYYDYQRSGSAREWETSRVSLEQMLTATLNNQQVIIRDKEGKVEAAPSIEAQQKQEAIRKEFQQWAWADTDRALLVKTVYNKVHNATVLASHDGAHLTLPGMSDFWRKRLKPHQVNAIWRAILEGNTYLAHTMGAGKTVVMSAIAMEYRRLGLARKPLIVIPKQTLSDYSKLAEIYPGARILIGTKDETQGNARKQFMARIATGDWDAIIVTRDAMIRMPAGAEAWKEFITEQIEELRAAASDEELAEVERAGAGGKKRGRGRLSDLARKIATLEARLEEIQKKIDEKKDVGLSWEDLGVDMLLVDEAHGYRKMTLATQIKNVAGIPTGGGSQRGNDLYIKARQIQKNTPGRNLVFASGTPLVNSVAELYILQRFLQPEALKMAGVETFDAWAATFGHIVTKYEADITGTKLKLKRRFAEFSNLNGLIQMFRSVMDVMMPEDLHLPTPPVTGGEAMTHSVDAGEELKAFIQRLAERVRRLDPRDLKSDNMLKISTDGRKAALDLRLVGVHPGGHKLEAIAEQVIKTYEKWDKKKGTQLVFMELGVPGGGFSTYDDLKQRLVDGGIRPSQIAFIQDGGKSDAARDALMSKMRDGQIRVLIGPRETMGTGVNVQSRLVALHHADPHWLPALIEQADGRGIRQGNLFFMPGSPEQVEGFSIDINHYIVKGSFDAFMWQAVAWKGKMINQALRGNLSMDRIEEIGGGAVFNAAEIAAIATGNPIMVERMQLEQTVGELEIMEDAHRRANTERARDLASLPTKIEAAEESQVAIKKMVAQVAEPVVTIGGVIYDDMAEANKAIRDRFGEVASMETALGFAGAIQTGPMSVYVPAGDISGFPVMFEFVQHGSRVDANLVAKMPKPDMYDVKVEGIKSDPVGRLVERIPQSLGHKSEMVAGDLARMQASLAEAEKKQHQPFKQAEELAAAKVRLVEINDELGRNTSETQVAPEEKDDPDDDPTDDDSEDDDIASDMGFTMDDVAESKPRKGTKKGATSPVETVEAPPVPPTTGTLTGRALGTVVPGSLTDSTTRPIEFPELVELATELISTPSVVKGFRNAEIRGQFRGMRGIALRANLFKKGNEIEVARTLAHEIGHLVDWLPTQTLKRGNLLGRLRSLSSFLKHTWTDPSDGTKVVNKEVKEELIAVSAMWRPWDRAKASNSHAKYRDSARELYADALSMLLNDPGQLERLAPTFYREFFAALDEKPAVKDAYFSLMDVLSGTPQELIARRRARVRAMYYEGDQKALDIQKRRLAERQEAGRADLGLALKSGLLDKHSPIIDRVKNLEKRGVKVAAAVDPRYLLEERNYMDGRTKAFTAQHFQPVYEAITESGIGWDRFGEALLYERIIAGDRSEIANPLGIQPGPAADQHRDLLEELTEDQRAILTQAIADFRAAVRLIADEAYASGLYTDKLYEQIGNNPAYVSFRVIEHLEDDVTSKVYKQKGTLKGITNPGDATILKTLVTIRAIEHNNAKVGVFKFLTEAFPKDIQQAREIGSPKGPHPVEPDKNSGLTMVTYMERGRLRGKYVDPYVAASLNNERLGSDSVIATKILRLIGLPNNFFRPIFTSLNLGFQAFNVFRDFGRFWKNTPGMTLRRALTRYSQGVQLARTRAFGVDKTSSPKAMRGYADLLEAENSKILDVTLNDLLMGREPEDTFIEETLARMGAIGHKMPKRHPLIRPLLAIGVKIKEVGDFIETLPKAAGIYEAIGEQLRSDGVIVRNREIKDIPADQRSFIRRKQGSPDFRAGGTLKPATNEIFLFSNAITQAWRADIEVATDPTTRSGFWMKTAMVNLLPKALLMALMMGAGGDELKKLIQKITEYDRTNYIPVPLGVDDNGNLIYLRLPQDDSGRMLGGLFWKGLQAARGDRDVMDMLTQVFDYTAGQVPSVTPAYDVVSDWATMLSGRNPYDDFRQRSVLTDDEQQARGLPAWKKFLGWQFQQVGGSIVWKFHASDRPTERTVGQTLIELPLVSNIIGRFIRISNQGERESLRDAAKDVAKDEAKRRISETEAVSERLRTMLKQDESERVTPAVAAVEIAQALYPDDRKLQNERLGVLRSKVKLGLARGRSDAVVDAVMSAGSIAQKTAVLLRVAESMDKDAFSTWLHDARRDGVISQNVVIEVLKAQRAPQ